jgi:hypothetical protein
VPPVASSTDSESCRSGQAGAQTSSVTSENAMVYQEWGFLESPFETTSLPANDLGESLLVGRDQTLESLMRRIVTGSKISTVEGLNGVGKTSVVNVSAHKLFKRHLTTGDGPLFIPCRKIFQLDTTRDLGEFVDSVLMEVAQTLIDQSEAVKVAGYYLTTASVSRWLNSPQLVSYQGGVSVVQFGSQQETNTSIGFERSGFRKIVTSWLEIVFPTPSDGGVICTIDNLELLQSSDEARRMLENLRDELFNIIGLRWVVCGSLGIIYGVVSSPRLEGYLQDPVEVGEIGEDHAAGILASRIRTYTRPDHDWYLPLTAEKFEKLYGVLRGNIRSVLGRADNYCQWIGDRANPQTDDEKNDIFEVWLTNQSTAAYGAVRQALRPKALEVFSKACEKAVFSPSDYEDFGFNSIPAFRPHVKDLEDVGVVVSTQDEGDKRRKTIQVTPKGWMVAYHIDHQGRR